VGALVQGEIVQMKEDLIVVFMPGEDRVRVFYFVDRKD
jgi:hypothetical protein